MSVLGTITTSYIAGSIVVNRQRSRYLSLDIGTDIDDPLEFEKNDSWLRRPQMMRSSNLNESQSLLNFESLFDNPVQNRDMSLS